MKNDGFSECCQDFFGKKAVCPAIKRKGDALIEMKALRETPRNAARKSYEAAEKTGRRGDPPGLCDVHSGGHDSRLKRT